MSRAKTLQRPELEDMTRRLRRDIITSTTTAGSPDGVRLPPRSAGRRTERGVRRRDDQV